MSLSCVEYLGLMSRIRLSAVQASLDVLNVQAMQIALLGEVGGNEELDEFVHPFEFCFADGGPEGVL